MNSHQMAFSAGVALGAALGAGYLGGEHHGLWILAVVLMAAGAVLTELGARRRDQEDQDR